MGPIVLVYHYAVVAIVTNLCFFAYKYAFLVSVSCIFLTDFRVEDLLPVLSRLPSGE